MNRSPWRLEEVDGSPWRLEEVDDGNEQYPVESRFAVRHTPPDEQDPRFDRSAPTQVCFIYFAVRRTPPDQQDPRFDRRRSVSSVLWYARPLPMNRIPFRTWPVEHKAVSFVLQYARPCFHRLFRPSPLDEHDHAFRSDPAGWLPINTTMTLFLRSDPAIYVGASRRSRPFLYVCTWPYFLSCTLSVVRTCTCYVRASTTTRARLYID